MRTKKIFWLNIGLIFGILTACGTSPFASNPISTQTVVPPTKTPTLLTTATPVDTVTPLPTPTAMPYPAKKGYHSMVYDSESNKVILLGGEYDDIWSYDTKTNTWAELEPLVDDFGAFAYDTESDRVIGYMNTKSGGLSGIGITLAYDFNTGSLIDLENDSTPVGYLGAQLAYDSESDCIILFGGYLVSEHQIIDETWAYDYDSNTWMKMAPNINPPGRNYPAMVYIPTIDRVLMFGGDILGPTESATWLYDFDHDTWERLESREAPIVRWYSSMVYVASLDRIILFGGKANTPEGISNEMWAFDPNEYTWTEMKPEKIPSARAWHAMAYDSSADKIILFGGGKDNHSFTNETWVYDPQTNIWTDMTPGH